MEDLNWLNLFWGRTPHPLNRRQRRAAQSAEAESQLCKYIEKLASFFAQEMNENPVFIGFPILIPSVFLFSTKKARSGGGGGDLQWI